MARLSGRGKRASCPAPGGRSRCLRWWAIISEAHGLEDVREALALAAVEDGAPVLVGDAEAVFPATGRAGSDERLAVALQAKVSSPRLPVGECLCALRLLPHCV